MTAAWHRPSPGSCARRRPSRYLDTETARIDPRTADAAGQRPQAVTARYDRRLGCVVVVLSSGLEIVFKPHEAPGLQHANSEPQAEIEISPSGQGLHFPQIDADLDLPALLQSLSGSN